MSLFLYNLIAGVIFAALSYIGLLWHDASVYADGEMAGYARAVDGNKTASKLAADAYAAQAAKLTAALEDKRRLSEKLEVADAEADDELDAELAKTKGKDSVAWSAEVSRSLRR